ncbi:LRC59-like protein, partial [Mya arenaria]
MPKDNLKDKLEGNEIDLSLNNLTAVPVKELAEIPKATHLDLSCNLLADLPDTFCSLTYLVKIDLSKNLLTSLPDDFGNLTRLQYLDLLGNKLTVLPVSVYQLTKLKWLDLKDNPLAPEFKAIAGDCLDEKQCKKCAKDIVDHMRIEHNRIEKKLQIQRDDEKSYVVEKWNEFSALVEWQYKSFLGKGEEEPARRQTGG